MKSRSSFSCSAKDVASVTWARANATGVAAIHKATSCTMRSVDGLSLIAVWSPGDPCSGPS